MSKRPSIPPSAVRKATPLPAALLQELTALLTQGQWAPLEAKARAAATQVHGQPVLWQVLATAQLQQGKWSDAAASLSHLLRLAPGNADALGNLGVALAGCGRQEEARRHYERALEIDPNHAMTHGNFGMLLGDLGEFAEAERHLKRALELNPGSAASHSNLAKVYRDQGRLREAEAECRAALAMAPAYFEAQANLAITLHDLQRFEESRVAFIRAHQLRPDTPIVLNGLAKALRRLGRTADGIAVLERCLALAPGHVESCIDLGNALLEAGQPEASRAMFRRLQAMQPLITHRAARTARFSVAMLDTPGAGCTPIEYLAGGGAFTRHLYCVMPEPAPAAHVALLHEKADLVFNMIADADNGADILPVAAELADRIGRPVVNHPRRVMRSGRAEVAQRLAGTPLCRVPRTLRLAGAQLLGPDAAALLQGLQWPLLVRHAGQHGGEDFEKFDDPAGVAGFVATHPAQDYYVTEYVDYASPDGLYRKYRFICIDGRLLPYHLAIHDHWKVHHFRTDMANQAWMRAEEEAFLAAPERVFPAPLQDAMRAMAAAIGLDYCGLDVALDREGRVVLFETNAAMLVHDEKGDTFAYKNPYIARIREAFGEMLERRVAAAVEPAAA